MSSTFSSRPEPPSRTWWSLSPKGSVPAAQDIRRAYSNEKHTRHNPTKPGGLNFNSFASVMGFKSKKHPSLAIQDPPLPTRTVTPPSEGPYIHSTSSPTSKSPSSTRSRVDSLEPRTPVDLQRDPRRSLLTLSDIDPFAPRGISLPHAPSDSHRLSQYSNSSIADYASKNGDVPSFNRGSYASSSSHSNQHGTEVSPSNFVIPTGAESAPKRKLKSKKSVGTLHRKQSLATADGSLTSAWESIANSGNQLAVKSGSTSALVDKNRLSQPDPGPRPRPAMRARGMTDSGGKQRAGFLQQESSTSKTISQLPLSSSHSQFPPHPVLSPRVIIRQASVSRIGTPPSAPPRKELPPPPLDAEIVATITRGSGSSSTLSFASSVSSNREILVGQPYSPRQREKRPMERTVVSGDSLATARTLKKAASHQSLVKQNWSSSLSPIQIPPVGQTVDLAPRKQRSFYQPKALIPSIPPPIRHVSSFGSQPTISSNTPISEQRRGSASGTPGRKRLFSGSSQRRPSTTQCITSEDDSQSVLSIRSDQEPGLGASFFKPLSPTTSSFWDEGIHDSSPGSPLPTAHEYTPQHIMSPAEIAEVEASVEEESIYVRKRGLSTLSAPTRTSESDEELVPTGLSPSVQNTGKPDNLLGRSTSLLDKGLAFPLRLSSRPSTSQADTTLPLPNSSSTNSSLPSPLIMTSLPPPPRPRPRPPVGPLEERLLITPLTPPPIRRNIRPKISVEKALHRKSIMRKPSFLEIDDDTDQDSDSELKGKLLNDSFLDLARESFDTVRSINE